MYKLSKIMMLSFLIIFWSVGNVFALSLGLNITVNDNINNSTYGSQPSQALGQGGEDNETEQLGNLGSSWNTYTGQKWDFEGMFWDSLQNKLSIVAGWNFQTGVPYNNGYVLVGDLFGGTWGSEVNGSYTFNPDWVLDFQRNQNGGLLASGSYSMIGGSFNVLNTEYHATSPLSDPWEYKDSGSVSSTGTYTISGPVAGSSFSPAFLGWTDYPTGGYDDNHYILTINGLSDADVANLLHITLYCGNDVGKGQYSPVPEPASLFLLGLGLAGIASTRKRYRK